MRAYAEHGRVDFVVGREQAQARTVEAWRDLRQDYGDDVLIVTRRNCDAVVLNQLARDILRSEGLKHLAVPIQERKRQSHGARPARYARSRIKTRPGLPAGFSESNRARDDVYIMLGLPTNKRGGEGGANVLVLTNSGLPTNRWRRLFGRLEFFLQRFELFAWFTHATRVEEILCGHPLNLRFPCKHGNPPARSPEPRNQFDCQAAPHTYNIACVQSGQHDLSLWAFGQYWSAWLSLANGLMPAT